jgi:HD-GYP domain-containing protein (c-di-GMP phosphodiesterase class II)
VTTLRARLEDGGIVGGLLVIALAALLSVWAVVDVAVHGHFDQPRLALVCAVFIAVGELARITLPGGRDAAPIGTAGALGYALIPEFFNHGTTYGAMQVVAVTAIATLAGALPHTAVGRTPPLDSIARRILSVAVAALVFRSTSLLETAQHARGEVRAAILVGVVVVALLTDAAIAAAVRAGRDRAPYRPVLRDEIKAQIGIGAAIGASGALIALAASIMNYWAFPVFVIPLLLTQFAFRRYAAIRETYLQTVRALSRVTELGGYTESGHSRRVSQIAVAVGRELGMGESELLDLEYAALMHDIGQLSLAEPIPGGATVVAAPTEQKRIAGLGADIIRQTGVLDSVATVVERQAEPYRRAHENVDKTVPLASRIIKAVNAYDDLVGEAEATGRRLDALERLRLGMAYEYDPGVVESLARVLERSSRLGG